MKKRIAFLLIYFSFILPGKSFLVKAELINKEYKCEGVLNTMLRSSPITVTLRNQKLSWKINRTNIWSGSDFLDLYNERENIEFDVEYSDGVLVKRIDENKLSVKMGFVTGTFLEDSCQLEMPLEEQYIESIGPILNFFGF